ncbi:hypothetical protein [Haloterrigena alkaliphila]|uniref:Uncharacterized protein n=1 Tax=Haloterrigena alkaliphila TaxID=2816475 RepID=A0A8A2VHC0_9EURY|nr:hypothetical protein [Haloterrigena alkaliphila]QSW99805.1 hypothetical protein J0X25_02250 [Haloterrigena alkaliphila]
MSRRIRDGSDSGRRLIPSDWIRADATIEFALRFLILAGGATAIAVGVVLLSSGVVDVELGEQFGSGVVTGLSLLVLSLGIAAWYELQESRSGP